ncbi:hypothetical protein TRIATDRAFT_288813, partial [Trichoderma atroviride IMI 206040]
NTEAASRATINVFGGGQRGETCGEEDRAGNRPGRLTPFPPALPLADLLRCRSARCLGRTRCHPRQLLRRLDWRVGGSTASTVWASLYVRVSCYAASSLEESWKNPRGKSWL